VVFHATLAAETGAFGTEEVAEGIRRKLIRRHPHVFGDGEVETTDDVNRQWERIKMNEAHRPRLLDGVPRHQPALNRAYRVQEKAAAVGFDWPDMTPVWDKVTEEVDELREAVVRSDAREIEREFGDLLFAMVNLGRKLGIYPEEALRSSISKFTDRFRYIEERLDEAGVALHESTLEEMDRLWDEAKARKI